MTRRHSIREIPLPLQVLHATRDLLFLRDERGQSYAHAPGEGGGLLLLRGRPFRLWLMRRALDVTGHVLGASTLSAIILAMDAQAQSQPPQTLWNRVARAKDGAIWLDLCTARRDAIEILPGGFRSTAAPPLFRRYSHQQPLPPPDPHGALDELCDLLNLPDEADRMLFLCTLVVALVPDVPQPLLLLSGPQGSAKTTAARLRRALVDPSCLPTVNVRHGTSELMQALDHHYMPVLDNLSRLTPAQEALLCQAATGAGFAKRALYTDQDDVVLSFRRPVVLTGINLPTAAPDLLDRAILIHLERLSPTQRRDERSLWAAFERERPRYLGGLLRALSGALQRAPTLTLPGLWRMADFTRLGAAAAIALGYSVERFCEALAQNAVRQSEEVLADDPVARAVRGLLERTGSFHGTATALLAVLLQQEEAAELPRQAALLGRRLNQLRASLQELGIQVRWQRTPDACRERQWTISR